MKKNSFVVTISICVLTKLLLDIVFVYIIASRYSYYGFVMESNYVKTIMAWIEIFVVIPFLYRYLEKKRLREYVMIFLILMYYIPGVSFYQHVQVDNHMFLLWNCFWLELFFWTSIKRSIKYNQIPCLISRFAGVGVVLLISIIVICISWRYVGLRMIITFTNEYSLRAEERQIVLPIVLEYLYSMSPIILSLGIVFTILRRNYVGLCLLVAVQILNFSIGGHKTILLLTIISVMIGLFWERLEKKYGNIFLVFLFAFELVFEIVVYLLTGKIGVTANISRRVYFIPQLLNIFYYDFFTIHKVDYYAQGPGRILGLKSIYDVPVSNLISNIYFGMDGNSNNGLFSEAYANMGAVGCFVLPIVILIILSILELGMRNKNNTVVLLFSFFCAFIWGSGNITTGLITNGLLMAALIISISPSMDDKGKRIDVTNR